MRSRSVLLKSEVGSVLFSKDCLRSVWLFVASLAFQVGKAACICWAISAGRENRRAGAGIWCAECGKMAGICHIFFSPWGPSQPSCPFAIFIFTLRYWHLSWNDLQVMHSYSSLLFFSWQTLHTGKSMGPWCHPRVSGGMLPCGGVKHCPHVDGAVAKQLRQSPPPSHTHKIDFIKKRFPFFPQVTSIYVWPLLQKKTAWRQGVLSKHEAVKGRWAPGGCRVSTLYCHWHFYGSSLS